MRSPVAVSPKGLQVRAIAGTYVVLITWDGSKAYCKGVLGFGIERIDRENQERIWLRGLKKFDLPHSDAGDDPTTHEHPIQKFHWGDYTTKPGRRYTYIVHAMSGAPGALVSSDEIAVDVTCETPDRIGNGVHAVHFNRSAAASQAFSRRFANLPKGDVVDPNARVWLSRGLAEALIAFIDATASGEGLHLFVYEFEKPEFLDALKRAKQRGVSIEILFDALLDKNGKGPSKKSRPQMKKFGLTGVARARTGSGLNISHNKFMVRTDANGKPVAVWTGSTNFTDAGVYAQTNVGHAVADAGLARTYFDWHQDIWKDAAKSAADSRDVVLGLTHVPGANAPGTTLVLSPRKTIEAVTACATRVTNKHRLICFTAPFELHQDLQDAFAAAPAHVCGLLNKEGVVGKKLHAAPNTQLTAAGALDDQEILDAWQGRMLKESLHHSGVFIHTKIVLIDPLTDQPTVITGSANFSNNSSKNNDENQLFISGETAVADVYVGEFMRMFDHYYYRDHQRLMELKKNKDPKAGFLEETDHWVDRYFGGGEREAEREAFFG